MTAFVVDASVAIKWVLPEPGSDRAMTLLGAGALAAPELWWAECANILWKAFRRGELDEVAVRRASYFLSTAGVELVEMAGLFDASLRLAIELDHPACDTFYLALAVDRGVPMVTADHRLATKLSDRGRADLLKHLTPLGDLAL